MNKKLKNKDTLSLLISTKPDSHLNELPLKLMFDATLGNISDSIKNLNKRAVIQE
jgi:hypothetical protein